MSVEFFLTMLDLILASEKKEWSLKKSKPVVKPMWQLSLLCSVKGLASQLR
jgi:hypothetical protein